MPLLTPSQPCRNIYNNPCNSSFLPRPRVQAGLGLALAVVFVALNAATGNWRAAALATFCVVGTFSSAAGIGAAMLYWRLGVPVAVPLMLMLACGPPIPESAGAHMACQPTQQATHCGACLTDDNPMFASNSII